MIKAAIHIQKMDHRIQKTSGTATGIVIQAV